MAQILLIEDDDKIGAYLQKGLRQEGHTVDWEQDGQAGLGRLLAGGHDVAIVDMMLPGLPGREVISKTRARQIRIPILVLSAKSDVSDRVAGLYAGADDYLTKPFSFVEVVARIEALLRRADDSPTAVTELHYKELHLNLLSRRARRGERQIDLQPKEFALLEYFMRSPERVLTKTMILERVWEYNFDPQTNVVDVLVCRLRAKIDRDEPTKLLHTVRGVGYVLREE